MEELHREGRIRAIGLSNFQPDRVMDMIMHHEVVPAVNQVETHPINQQIETQKFLQENGVQIESWGRLPRAGTICSKVRCWFHWPPNIKNPWRRLSCAG